MLEAQNKELQEQIRFKDFKLNSLLEITKAINSNLSVDKLTQIYEYIMREQLGLKKFILFHRKIEWECLLKVGVKGRIKEIDVAVDLLRFEDITVIESSHRKELDYFDVVIPVYHKENPLAFLLLGDIKKEKYILNDTINNLTFVQTLTNIMVVAIENKRLANESLKQERYKKELEVASALQTYLFPDKLPSNSKIDISAKYLSRHEVGGDYYDYIQINQEEFIICMADVSGKGVSAAMLMANFQASLRTLYKYNRFPLKKLIIELNKNVMQSAKGEKFITFFIAEYNANTRVLRYINAGHNYPIITNGKAWRQLNKGCIGLGMLEEIPIIDVEEIDIKPNTTIYLYTDGVVELENKNEEQFQVDNLVKILKDFYPLKMEDLNEIVFSKLDEWRGKKTYTDDTAVLGCRIF